MGGGGKRGITEEIQEGTAKTKSPLSSSIELQ